MNYFFVTFLLLNLAALKSKAFVSTNQSTFDIFGEEFHHNYLSEDYEDETEDIDLHTLNSYEDSFYDDVNPKINDSLLDYDGKSRPKRSIKTKGLRYGIELKCDGDNDCHEWVNQRHFCVIGRCIQLFCETNHDCPKTSQCYDGLCIVVTSCKNTNDCQDGLLCLNGKCSPKDDTDGHCQDDDDCDPVDFSTKSR